MVRIRLLNYCSVKSNLVAGFLTVLGLLCLSYTAVGQVETGSDTSKVQQVDLQADTSISLVSFNALDSTTKVNDTLSVEQNDVSALDIGSSRGIYILSSDRLMQLRILGSIRASYNYSNQELLDNQTGCMTKCSNVYLYGIQNKNK